MFATFDDVFHKKIRYLDTQDKIDTCLVTSLWNIPLHPNIMDKSQNYRSIGYAPNVLKFKIIPGNSNARDLPDRKTVSGAVKLFRAHNPSLIENSTSFDEEMKDTVYIRTPIYKGSERARVKLAEKLSSASFKFKGNLKFVLAHIEQPFVTDTLNFSVMVPSAFYNSLNFLLEKIFVSFDIITVEKPSEGAMESIGPATYFNVQVMTRVRDSNSYLPSFAPFAAAPIPELSMYSGLSSIMVSVLDSMSFHPFCRWCGSLTHYTEDCSTISRCSHCGENMMYDVHICSS